VRSFVATNPNPAAHDQHGHGSDSTQLHTATSCRALLRQHITICLVIIAVEEGLLPPIIALRHMVRKTVKNHTRKPGYDAGYINTRPAVDLMHCHRSPKIAPIFPRPIKTTPKRIAKALK